MWVLKLKAETGPHSFGYLAKKYGVSFSGYPVSSVRHEGHLMVRVAGFIEGVEKDVKRFVKAVRKEPFIDAITCKKNFGIAVLKLPLKLEVLYDPHILWVQPSKYGKDGSQQLELACWEKEPLMKVLPLFTNPQVLTFRQQKIDSIGLISIHPELTQKQRLALQLAVKHGYYGFPRKVTLEKLAQIMGVSFSTYQAHLAKAEAHFLPEMVEKFL
jgi:hypothetical protein